MKIKQLILEYIQSIKQDIKQRTFFVYLQLANIYFNQDLQIKNITSQEISKLAISFSQNLSTPHQSCSQTY